MKKATDVKEYNLDTWWIFSPLFWLKLGLAVLAGLIVWVW